MPIIKSSMKDIRRTKRRTARNSALKNKIRTIIKSVRMSKTEEEAKKNLVLAMKVLDQACSKDVIKRKNASRHKSRLSIMVHKKFKKA